MDILQEIIAWKRIEVEQFKSAVPPKILYDTVENMLERKPSSMRRALADSRSGIIAEFKRRSPSTGWIRQDGRADCIPVAYQRNGAAALSILTDQKYFGGQDDYIAEARLSGVSIPILYKNFVVDEYQIFQARKCGASAVLLIAAALPLKQCRQLLHTAHQLGLEVLLEIHGEGELDYAELEPDMLGVNNRHLGTFVTDVKVSFDIAGKLPREGCKVSESGISNPQTVADLRAAGFKGFSMGEFFMKNANPAAALYDFIRDLDNKSSIEAV